MGLGDLVAPLRCVACGTWAADLCGPCAQRLVVLAAPLCGRCGSPSQKAVEACGDCRALRWVWRARSLLVYAGPARPLVVELKRRGRPALARAAGGLLADLARREGLEADLVCPVPAGRRAVARGFDHADLLARAVAAALGLPYRRALVRRRDGGRQSALGAQRRRQEAAGAFWARRAASSVLVVDDVLTTGATADACAAALRRAGAERVAVVTLARTVRRRPVGPDGG